MRTHFQSDEEIPPSAWQIFPELKQKLDRIIELEDKLGSALSSRKRITFAINSEPELKTKILRIHLRHQFFPLTALDKAHFLITVEGHLLDKSAARTLPFGNFLDKIRIQLDKRFHPVNNLYEWSADSFPEGVKGHCFRIKAYGDKPFPIKVFLHRSNDIRPRYELSPLLREILPSMQMDPSEEQVLLALWSHLSTNNMLEGRDRRQIKCSMELKNLFGVESFPLQSLRQKIADHLTVCKPIQVEYNVTTASTVLSTSFGPNAIAKAGGKAFDIEVDVRDPYAFDLLESVNDINRNQKEMLETISQMEQRASFLADSIIECSNNVFAKLKRLQNDPLSLQGGASSSSSHAHKSSSAPADPLLCTAAGESSSYPLRLSVPSELLQRAYDPFSLIGRRSVPASARIKRIIRPKTGSNPGGKDHDTDPPKSVEVAGGELEGERVSNPSIITASTPIVATGVDIGQNDVHPAAPITASAPAAAPVTAPVVGNTTIASSSASSQSQDAMDIATSSAGEDDKTDSDPPVGVEIAASVMKIEDTIKSSITLEEVDGGETKDENAGEEMNIEDESGHESHSSHLSSEGSGTIISKDEGEGGGIRLSTAVKDQIELISVKVETEKEKENEEEMKNGMEVEIESSSLSVKDEADVDVDIDPSCDTQSIKEEGIVDLLLVKGEIVDESSKEAGKVEGTPREEEIKLTVSSAVSVTPAPVPEPQRNAPLPPITLPRAPDSLSAIHGLRGFLDVGNDALFSTSEPWVLATASLLAKRKLARN